MSSSDINPNQTKCTECEKIFDTTEGLEQIMKWNINGKIIKFKS